jgi:hypothetical protein
VGRVRGETRYLPTENAFSRVVFMVLRTVLWLRVVKFWVAAHKALRCGICRRVPVRGQEYRPEMELAAEEGSVTTVGAGESGRSGGAGGVREAAGRVRQQLLQR